jgi:hypothetical protein
LKPDFYDFIKHYDIIGISETKLNDVDKIDIEGYELYTKNRTVFKNSSGGVAILVRSSLSKYVKIISNDNLTCKNALWCVIDEQLLGYKLICGCVYIPPEGSAYAQNNMFDDLQSDIVYATNFGEFPVCLMGDFNARTKNLNECVTTDDMNDEVCNLLCTDLVNNGKQTIPARRNNKDGNINNYGRKLIELCQGVDIYIINGRCGKDADTGAPTCMGTSTVDYFIASPAVFTNINNFEVLEFDELLSDVHCPVSMSLDLKVSVKGDSEPDLKHHGRVHRPFWSENIKTDFVKSIPDDTLQLINRDAYSLLSQDNISREQVNDFSSKLCSFIIDHAKSVGCFERNVPQSRQYKRKRAKQPWFNRSCEEKRKAFFKAKNRDRRLKSDTSRVDRTEASKSYKKELNKQYRLYQTRFVKKLRTLKNTDPRAYWKVLSKDTKAKSDILSKIHLDTFAEHFKKLNPIINNDPNDFDVNDIIDGDGSLNDYISVDETKQMAKKLKNQKACGVDQIINEFLTCAIEQLASPLTSLFNAVLKSGKVPDEWTMGIIKPIYKQKGDPLDPDNYRGITLISCLCKLFTGIINKRLNKFLENQNILGEEQAGFREGYSTVDHIFTMQSIINLYLCKRKRIYCAFIDYQKAFDSINRIALWKKLISLNIKGNVLRVIYDMYSNAKSCVRIDNADSEYFSSSVGIRQGDNLSPLLFCIYLNDMQSYIEHNCNGLTHLDECFRNYIDDYDMNVYMKLYLLLYADDTVVLAETPEDLQAALDSVSRYCHTWDLNVNISKTKIVIFSRGKVRNYPRFLLKDEAIEVVDDYTYLGVVLNYNGSVSKTEKKLSTQANKAVFSLLQKCKKLQLPVDLQLELFDAMVKPIILYGCESWGYNSSMLIERVHLKFCKLVLRVRNNTPSVMVYGELGRVPMNVYIKQRMLSYWFKIMNCDNACKLSFIMYKLMYSMHVTGTYSSPWIVYIQNTFNDLGLSYFWEEQDVQGVSLSSFKALILQRLTDQFIQEWSADVYNSSSCYNYRIYKTTWGMEKYLTCVTENLRIPFTRFRLLNNKLPVTKLRYEGVPRSERLCTLCNSNKIGDEFHYVLECPYFVNNRKIYLKKYYNKDPNTFKLNDLFNCTGKNLISICQFTRIIMRSLI